MKPIETPLGRAESAYLRRFKTLIPAWEIRGLTEEGRRKLIAKINAALESGKPVPEWEPKDEKGSDLIGEINW